MSNYSLCVLVLTLVGNEARAQGTLVVNGGFDSGISGWGASNISGNGGWFPGKGNPGGAFLITGTPSPSTDPMIFQTITGLTPGTTYSISGDYAFSDDFHDTSTNASFGVALDGVFMFEASKPAAPVWLSFNFPYTPASTSALLSLVAQRNGTTVGYGIDNIAITVPEPSAFCILVAAVFLGLNNSGTRRNRPSRGSS